MFFYEKLTKKSHCDKKRERGEKRKCVLFIIQLDAENQNNYPG